MVNRGEIVDAIYRLQKLYDVPGISFSSNIQRTVMLAHGWYVRCNRTATAIMLLETRRLEHEAAPLRRALIEHAVGLAWLEQATEDAVNSLLRGYQSINLKKLREVLEKVSPEQGAAFNGIIDIEVAASSEDQYLAFRKLCERFGVDRIYGEWLRNTALSHATYASAVAYIDGSNGDLDLSREPNYHPDASTEIATLLLLASHSFNELLEGKPWTSALQEIENQIVNAMQGASE
jgi:hypothetical protein